MRRKALDNLLPEEFRRFDVANRSYIRSQEDPLPEPPPGPPPKRVIVAEKPLVRRPDPAMGYAKLGYGSQVGACNTLELLYRALEHCPFDSNFTRTRCGVAA